MAGVSQSLILIAKRDIKKSINGHEHTKVDNINFELYSVTLSLVKKILIFFK